MEKIRNDIFKNVPFVDENNHRNVFPAIDEEHAVAYWKDIQSCVRVLKEKWGNLVDGLWFIREPADDGGVQYIYRTSRNITGRENMKISGDICSFTGHELLFAMTHDVVYGASADALEEAVEDGIIYAVFDDERK